MSLNIHILPKGIDVEHIPGNTILESALAAGIRLPHSCDAGSCQICTSQLIHGTIKLTSNTGDILISHNDSAHTDFLCCKAIPTTNCTMEINNVLAKGELPLVTVSCQITEATPLNHDVTRYMLRLPAGKKCDYHAGQYLELLVEKESGDESVFPFSIANAQNSDRTIELHIRNIPNSESLKVLKTHLKEGGLIKARFPKGDCTLVHIFPNDELQQNTETPLVLLAGSTGFAPIKAMIEDCITNNVERPIHLYWGGRTTEDLYLHELAIQWDKDHEQITYIPVISEPEKCNDWNGRTGFVHKAVMEDLVPFTKDLTIIAGGSPGMVHAAYDDFVEAGLNKDQILSDVFAYAPK